MANNDHITDETLCFVSKRRQTVIDTIDPKTGRGFYGGRDLENAIQEYGDAEIMSLDDFCTWKAEQQRTPIEWIDTTEGEFFNMMCVLPPAAHIGDAFLVGEPTDHDAGNGQPRFTAFRRDDHDNYLVASRPLTIAEFRSEVA